MKLYHGELFSRKHSTYVKTGEFRPPTQGEYYLSGAIPTAYRAPNDLPEKFHIMRPATKEERTCEWCGHALKLELTSCNYR